MAHMRGSCDLMIILEPIIYSNFKIWCWQSQDQSIESYPINVHIASEGLADSGIHNSIVNIITGKKAYCYSLILTYC